MKKPPLTRRLNPTIEIITRKCEKVKVKEATLWQVTMRRFLCMC